MTDFSTLIALDGVCLRKPLRLMLRYMVCFQMQEARVYHNKLVNLKKEMNNLTDRSAKIKVRNDFLLLCFYLINVQGNKLFQKCCLLRSGKKKQKHCLASFYMFYLRVCVCVCGFFFYYYFFLKI